MIRTLLLGLLFPLGLILIAAVIGGLWWATVYRGKRVLFFIIIFLILWLARIGYIMTR